MLECDQKCLDEAQINVSTGFVLNSLSLMLFLLLIVRSISKHKVYGFTLKLLIAVEVGILLAAQRSSHLLRINIGRHQSITIISHSIMLLNSAFANAVLSEDNSIKSDISRKHNRKVEIPAVCICFDITKYTNPSALGVHHEVLESITQIETDSRQLKC